MYGGSINQHFILNTLTEIQQDAKHLLKHTRGPSRFAKKQTKQNAAHTGIAEKRRYIEERARARERKRGENGKTPIFCEATV